MGDAGKDKHAPKGEPGAEIPEWYWTISQGNCLWLRLARHRDEERRGRRQRTMQVLALLAALNG